MSTEQKKEVCKALCTQKETSVQDKENVQKAHLEISVNVKQWILKCAW